MSEGQVGGWGHGGWEEEEFVVGLEEGGDWLHVREQGFKAFGAEGPVETELAYAEEDAYRCCWQEARGGDVAGTAEKGGNPSQWSEDAGGDDERDRMLLQGCAGLVPCPASLHGFEKAQNGSSAVHSAEYVACDVCQPCGDHNHYDWPGIAGSGIEGSGCEECDFAKDKEAWTDESIAEGNGCQ
ncbi:hypothetical protein SAMN05444141_1022 [Pseudovibrio denitrificans]|uniref:Uncharacterized protein n=1 Tax=Pseudovibrio denitrificans TaxID=258256 RepID=A0A1I6Z1U0_9HYPH|nr:hypothetical protein SAMN05444141_1022 [Pseudovibrio denitrificans]